MAHPSKEVERLPLLKRIFLDTYLEAEAESATFDNAKQARRAGLKVAMVCIVAAFSLTMIAYVGSSNFVVESLKGLGLTALAGSLETLFADPSNVRFARLAWWASVTVIFYFVFPALMVRFVLGERLADYGLRLKGAFKDYHLYLMMFALMVPLVFVVSYSSSFQAKYPFYKLQPGEPLYPRFWQWEFFYLLQFFALEFFFRGFMVHGTKQRFGYYSVFVMVIPYCMIHFTKPLPEAIAAIIAGVVLGTLSLKSGSILPGAFIHYGVAITMDLAALWQKGML
jgi:uncharacterized protein